MFDHLHIQHHVELFPRFGQRLGGGVAVVDVEPRLLRMDLRDGDVACCGIGTDHGRTQPRHRFRQQPAAAADVQNPQPAKRFGRFQVTVELSGDLGSDVIEPAGVEHMQRLELAVLVPPFGGHGLKLFDLGGVNSALRRLHSDLSVLFWVQ